MSIADWVAAIVLPLLPRDAEPEDEPPDDELNAGNGYKPLMNIEHLLARLDKIMGTYIQLVAKKHFHSLSMKKNQNKLIIQ